MFASEAGERNPGHADPPERSAARARESPGPAVAQKCIAGGGPHLDAALRL
jgi:hypothetical protein